MLYLFDVVCGFLYVVGYKVGDYGFKSGVVVVDIFENGI